MISTAALTERVSAAWISPELTDDFQVAASALEPSGASFVKVYGFRPYPNHPSLQVSPWRATILQERRLLMAHYRDQITARRLIFGDQYVSVPSGRRLFVKSVLPARGSVKAAVLVTNATGQNHISAIFMSAILALQYGLASYIIDDCGSGYSENSPRADELLIHTSDFLRVAMAMPDLMRAFYDRDFPLPWASVGFCGGAMVQLASLVSHSDVLARLPCFHGMVPIAPVVALPNHDTGSVIEQISEGFNRAQKIGDALMGVPGQGIC